jgi:hypothetical protein
LLARVIEPRFADADVQSLRHTREARRMVWTVLACTGGNCALAANQHRRAYVIPPLVSAITVLEATKFSFD